MVAALAWLTVAPLAVDGRMLRLAVTIHRVVERDRPIYVVVWDRS
jgi:hypothetical protein